MFQLIKHWFTERDNATFCVVRSLLASGGVAMIYNFIASGSHDFMGLGGGLSAIGASIAMKNLTEKG